MKIGYLIPEFPGQTHAFFWRELTRLEELGCSVSVVSTRRPAAGLMCHHWVQQALARTRYLTDSWVTLVGSLLVMGLLRPMGLLRGVVAMLQTPDASLKQKLRMLALVVPAARLARIAQVQRWGHLHVHSCADAAMIAVYAHFMIGLPYSLTLHGAIPTYGPAQSLKWLNASFGITVNHVLRQAILARVPGLAEDKVCVAPMGVDTAMFTRSRPYVPAAREGPIRIVSCGRLHAGKGHQDLIRAASLLRRGGLEVQLEILGEGPARSLIEAPITELRAGQWVSLRGAVDEASVRRSLDEAHVFVLASHDEALGVATMEAMAMRLPVVVTEVGGVAELVRDGIDGRLVPPMQPEALARAIEDLVTHPETTTAMGMAGAARVRERFHSGVSATVLIRRLGVSSDGGTIDLAGNVQHAARRAADGFCSQAMASYDGDKVEDGAGDSQCRVGARIK